MTPRQLARLALGFAAATLLSSCVQLPTEGPVIEEQGSGQGIATEGPFINPPPPQANDTPQEIAEGFLNAMTATPISTAVATEFLTKPGQVAWQPNDRTIIYTKSSLSGGSEVTVRLGGARSLGVRGDWEGGLPSDQSKFVLPMRPISPGQWRIARAPDAFIVPEIWYQQHVQSATLYFFDPTGRILVPETVHLPEDQLPTYLVRSLLLGPTDSLSEVERSFIPSGLSIAISVPVSREGVAQVTLKGPDPGSLSPKTTELMLAQFAWTLRQDPSVKSFQITIDGTPVSDASGASTFSVNAYNRYDPTKEGASAQLYALRHGRLVSGQANHLTAVDGPFGTRAQGIGPFAVSLDDTQIAGVTPFRLLTGAVRGNSVVRQRYSATGHLLRPSWDFAGRIWDVDQAPGGARVVVVVGARSHVVHVPGVTGQQVKRFLVSRDGSRLVAVIRGPRADRLVVARIRYDAQGNVRGATDPHGLPWEDGGIHRITDIGWGSPTTVDVLHQVTHQFAEVREIAVDGSTQQSEGPTATIDLARQGGAGAGNIRGRVKGLATSPASSSDGAQTSFAILPRTLVDIDQSAGTPAVSYRNLSHITYAG
jgi:hypothetical protein